MFVLSSDELNTEQKIAITEDNSVLLIACPGSGKTRTLAYKIAYELSRIPSSRKYIIAITYTNIAAEEIKERIELLGVNTNQLWIGTIHSFCLEWILRPYHIYLEDLKYGFRIINNHDSEKILSKYCKPYSKHKITYWDCGIIATTNGMKFTCVDKEKREYLRVIIGQYFEELKTNNQIDFEQILHYSYQLLLKKPIICSILTKLFPFILIDEYQDTKEIQYHIISMVLKANKGDSKLFIVGDPNQSIYQTLGGFPMNKSDLEELLGFKLKKMGLSLNYRSSEKIINYFNNYKVYPTEIFANGINKSYPSKITFNSSVSVNQLIDEIARLIVYNINEEGVSPNEICIVAPQWIQLASMTRNLMAKLPDYSFNGPGMAPFSRDIENFWFKLSRIVLTEPSPYMYLKRLRWSKEVLEELERAGINIPITNKAFLKICNSITIEEEDGLKYLEYFFNRVCEELKIEWKLSPMLYEHYCSFFESSRHRIKKLQDEGNQSIGKIDSFRKVFKQREGITISTIHGVKGEEYDTMIGFAILDDYVPHFSDVNGEINSQKMLYVLASRARKNLHLISEKNRKIHPKYKPYGLVPTPCLEECIFNYDCV